MSVAYLDRLRRLARRLRRLSFIGWCGVWLLVVWAMVDPSPPPLLPEVSDKLIHFASFFAVSFATIAFCRSLRHFLFAGGFCLVAGVLLEVVQWFTPPRQFELGDMAANVGGTVVGLGLAVLLLMLLKGRWRRRSPAMRRGRPGVEQHRAARRPA